MTDKNVKLEKKETGDSAEKEGVKIKITTDDDTDPKAEQPPPDEALDEADADDGLEGKTKADEDEAPSEGEDAFPEPEDKLTQLEAEAKENYERCLRISAEFDNYKKRSTREMENFRKFSNEALIKDLLPIIDNLERAMASTAEVMANNGGKGESNDGKVIAEGVDLTLKELNKMLNKYGVAPVEAVGKPFDPNFHEAAMQEPSDEHPANTVAREFQKGYLLHDRLLRPAMVSVSKGAPANEPAVEDNKNGK